MDACRPESYLRKGDVQQGINSLEKARQGQPDNTSLTTELAMLYESQNKTDVARKYYELAIKTDPNNALALNNLAYLDQRVERRPEPGADLCGARQTEASGAS